MSILPASWKDGLVQLPPIEAVRARLKYDPGSGSLLWIGRGEGKEAGCKQFRKNGNPNAIRVGFKINGRLVQYVAHRLIFLLMGVDIPVGMVIDHKDDNPFNNKWINLRVATHKQNVANQRKQMRAVRPKGVWTTPSNKFIGAIRVERRCIYSKTCATIEEAKQERDALAAIYHGEFARS